MQEDRTAQGAGGRLPGVSTWSGAVERGGGGRSYGIGISGFTPVPSGHKASGRLNLPALQLFHRDNGKTAT